MRVLFVTPYIPSRVRVRPFEFVRALTALGARVHLVALRPPEDAWASDAPMRAVCDQVDVFPLPRLRTLVNAGRAVIGSQSLQAAYSNHPDARRRVQALGRGGGFDVVHVEHLRGVVLVGGVTGLPVVFDAVDSISHLFEQTARLATGWSQRLAARVDLGRTRRFEARAPFQFNRTIVTSPVDRDAFVRRAGERARDRIAVVPNGVDAGYFQVADGARDPATILFSGKMSYHANAAAARQLAGAIMPEVWKALPDAKLVIAGKDPSDEVKALAGDARIEVTGYVDDLRPLFARATVAVAPLVYGAGIQNKVIEAMASGVPVVTSTQACGGLTAQHGRELLVGATAAEMAAQIVQLVREPALRDRLSAAGLAYIMREHDWAQLGQRLIAVYEDARKDYAVEPGRTASR
jgi:glycosyltransferase involved in cell wall biosynthesis